MLTFALVGGVVNEMSSRIDALESSIQGEYSPLPRS